MMAMPMRRKAHKMEKVEFPCRTAIAQKVLPTRRHTTNHACAIPVSPLALGARAASPEHPKVRANCSERRASLAGVAEDAAATMTRRARVVRTSRQAVDGVGGTCRK
jgi:hypothetical protein